MVTMFHRTLLVIILCSSLAGCTIPISKVLVSGGQNREHDFAAAKVACESVAANHGLSAKPPNAWGPGTFEYAKHNPPFGFAESSMVVCGTDPQYLAVITIAGEPMTRDRSRHSSRFAKALWK